MPFDDVYQSVLAPMYAVFGTASVQAQCDLIRCFTTMARRMIVAAAKQVDGGAATAAGTVGKGPQTQSIFMQTPDTDYIAHVYEMM
jgi:hypothetical protein